MSGRVLVVTEEAAAWRSTLDPTAWLVLEELALGSHEPGASVIAPLNARMIGERLGRSKDAVARALRGLAEAGLIERVVERDDFSSRFTSGHYVVDLEAAGLVVVDESEVVGDADGRTGKSVRAGSAVSGRSTREQRERAVVRRGEELNSATDLHLRAAPPRSRPALGGPDPVGSGSRTTYPPDPGEPSLFGPDLGRE